MITWDPHISGSTCFALQHNSNNLQRYEYDALVDKAPAPWRVFTTMCGRPISRRLPPLSVKAEWGFPWCPIYQWWDVREPDHVRPFRNYPPLFKSSAWGEEGDQSGGMYTEGLWVTHGQRHLLQGVGCLSSGRRTGSNRLTPWRQGDLQPQPSHLFGAFYLPDSDPTSKLPLSIAHVPVLPWELWSMEMAMPTAYVPEGRRAMYCGQ